LGFDSRRSNDGIFLFATAVSRLALGPTQPNLKWVQGALFPELKRAVREADHSPTSSAKVMNVWSYTSVPLISFHGVVFS